MRYNDDDDDDDDEEDEYGGGYKYNEEIAVLEAYTQLMKDEILLVQAIVDQEQLELLIFKVDTINLNSILCVTLSCVIVRKLYCHIALSVQQFYYYFFLLI